MRCYVDSKHIIYSKNVKTDTVVKCTSVLNIFNRQKLNLFYVDAVTYIKLNLSCNFLCP